MFSLFKGERGTLQQAPNREIIEDQTKTQYLSEELNVLVYQCLPRLSLTSQLLSQMIIFDPQSWRLVRDRPR